MFKIIPDTVKYDQHYSQPKQKVQQQQHKNKFLVLNRNGKNGDRHPCANELNDDSDDGQYYLFNKNNEKTLFKQHHSSFLIMPDSVIEQQEKETEILQTYINDKNQLLNEIDKTSFNLNELIQLINKFLVKHYMLMNENQNLSGDLVYFKNLREKILNEINRNYMFQQQQHVVNSTSTSPISSLSNSPSPSSTSSTTSSNACIYDANLTTFGKLKPQQHTQSKSSPILKKANNSYCKQNTTPKSVTFNNNISLITQFDGDDEDDLVEQQQQSEIAERQALQQPYGYNQNDDDDDEIIIDKLLKKIHIEKNLNTVKAVVKASNCELCFQCVIASKLNDKYCENCFFYMKTNFNLQN